MNISMDINILSLESALFLPIFQNNRSQIGVIEGFSTGFTRNWTLLGSKREPFGRARGGCQEFDLLLRRDKRTVKLGIDLL